MRTLSIRNNSNETIKNIKIALGFDDKSVVLAAECKPNTSITCSVEVKNSIVMITVERLNPFRQHGDSVTANIICDGDTKIAALVGSGDGWSARQISKRKDRTAALKALGVLFGIVLLTTIAGGIEQLSTAFFPKQDFPFIYSLLSMLAATCLLGVFVLVIVLFAGIVNWFNRLFFPEQ